MTWPVVIAGGNYSIPTTMDVRTLPHYVAAKARDRVIETMDHRREAAQQRTPPLRRVDGLGHRSAR